MPPPPYRFPSTAHLVLTVDIIPLAGSRAPRIVHAGIYSETAGSLTLRHTTGTVYIDGPSAEGENYGEARENLLQFLTEHPWWAWVVDRLDRRLDAAPDLFERPSLFEREIPISALAIIQGGKKQAPLEGPEEVLADDAFDILGGSESL